LVHPALALGLFFLANLAGVLLFWPRWGGWWRWRHLAGRAEKILIEDSLKHLYHMEYEGRPATLGSLAGVLEISPNRAAALIERTQAMGLIELRGDSPVLSADGRSLALHVIRVHRLWESYLAESTGMSSLDWHREAERREHTMTPAQTLELEARLNRPSHDPHGDPIPTAEGRMPPPSGLPLTDLELGQLAVIQHVEDEPEDVYAQIVALDLRPGVRVRRVEQSQGQTRLCFLGREVVLSSLVASNITVGPVPISEPESLPAGPTLADLAVGQRGQVRHLDSSCRGLERQRLLDLGLVPGTWVEARMRGPLGDPTAYWVRGASIAIRKEMARRVLLEPVP
jgi:DtxR family Mn-dependent transcriptional regulator